MEHEIANEFLSLLEDFASKFRLKIVPYGRAGSDKEFAKVALAFEKFYSEARKYLETLYEEVSA